MSKAPILEIEPKELKFIFELKKQSSCSVQLINNTFHYVAFKVKTTSPKKYSVRPNVGVLMPKATCDFIVTMQAQRVPPEDMVCKDKFLIQSTMVSAETTPEDVTSSLFVKDGSKYIEENKLKVTLISPPNSPDVSPINGDFKNGLDHEKVQIYSKDEVQSPEHLVRRSFTNVLKNPDMVQEVVKQEEDMELRPEHYTRLDTMKDVGESKEGFKMSKNKELNMVKDAEELRPQRKLALEVTEDLDLNKVKNAEDLKPEKAIELKVSKDLDLNKVKNTEELKPGKAVELKVSKDLDLNKVKNTEVLKPEKAIDMKVSKELDSNNEKNAEEMKPEKAAELKTSKVLDLNPVNNLKELKPEKQTEFKMSRDLELKTGKNVEELKPEKEAEFKMSRDLELKTGKNVEELKPEKEAELRGSKSIEERKLMKAIEEMKLKLDGLESKLNESGVTISKLTEERRLSNQETKILQEKLADLINKGPRKVQVGFPLLYVCMVALICVFLGYRLHS